MNQLKIIINRTSGLILALAIVLFAATALVTSPIAHAAPFTCEPAFYQAMTGTFKRLNPETGQYTDIGSTALYLNAIGYNTEDNYIYGLNNDPGGSTLMRIEHDGSYTDLGLPTGLPSTGSVLGDFDHSGNLYVMVNSPDSSLYRIDITADTATEIIMSDTLSVNDFAYINGFLYGTDGTSLYQIDVTTGTVTTTALGIPSAVYGAAWSTADDRLYFSQNNSGVIYQVTGYSTINPDATAVLQGDGNLVGNDGASCSLAPTVIIPVTAVDDTATTPADTPLVVSAPNGVLKNDSPDTITVTSNTQPVHGTVIINPDGSYTYTPNPGFSGTDTFNYTVSDTLGNSDSATVTITVLAAPPIQVPGPPEAGKSPAYLTATVTILGILGGFAVVRRAVKLHYK